MWAPPTPAHFLERKCVKELYILINSSNCFAISAEFIGAYILFQSIGRIRLSFFVRRGRRTLQYILNENFCFAKIDINSKFRITHSELIHSFPVCESGCFFTASPFSKTPSTTVPSGNMSFPLPVIVSR